MDQNYIITIFCEQIHSNKIYRIKITQLQYLYNNKSKSLNPKNEFIIP